MMRDMSVLVCVDDKHRVKVGEPLAAAECRCQVIVHSRSVFQVADHDFTRFSIIIYLNQLLGLACYDGCFTKMLPLNPLRQLDMLLSLCQLSEAKA